MEKKMNIRPSLGIATALLFATMFASCTKVELEAPSVKYGAEINFNISEYASKSATKSVSVSESKTLVAHNPNEPGSFGLSVTVLDGIQTSGNNFPETKGEQINSLNSFDVVSYFYAKEDSENGAICFVDHVTDGVTTNDGTYYWPSFGFMDFIATYPIGLIKDGIQTIADDLGHRQSFVYTIPPNVVEQQDIMIAQTMDVDCTAGTPVPLQFKHLLAAVQFKVGEMQFIKINSLKVTGIRGGDIEFVYDSENKIWTPDLTSATTVSYDLTALLPNTSGLAKGADITGNSYKSMLLVAPQTLSGAKIEVSYTETITELTLTKTVSLSGEWKAGMTTVYALNIAGTNFGTVEIPRPEDQDAHYIMLKMNYNMGTILNADKINSNSIKATAQWKENSGNTSTKSGISLKFESELTETQKQGFWTDKRYIETITVNSGGSSTTGLVLDNTTDSHGNSGLRGGTYLDITEQTGVIVLFIEENNGTTDREGELIFTATLASGKKIVLGEGPFKQLCPSWNSDGIGVERIESDAKSYSYGFDYTRKVIYENPGNSLDINWDFTGIIKFIVRLLYSWGANSLIVDDDGDFITIDYDGSIIESVTLDYGALNKVQEIANNDDGKENTKALYNFTAGVDIGQIETDFDQNLGWNKSEPVKGEGTPEDYAAFMALSRNRMFEKKTIVNSSQGNTTTYKAVLYKDGASDLEGEDIIEWYLPSAAEAEKLVETGKDDTGVTSSVIDNLNGQYWSSTAGSNTTPAQAYTFTYNNNTFGQVVSTARTAEHKVRAVRKKPTAN